MTNFGPLQIVGPQSVEHYSTANSDVQTPRALVQIAGGTFTPLFLEITENGHGVLDTAEFTLAISDNPDFSTRFQEVENDGAIVGRIFIGFLPDNAPANYQYTPNQLNLRFWGIVDTYEPDFGKDEIKVSMRSMGAMLELKKHTHGANQTTVQFIQSACNAVGLNFAYKLQLGQSPATLNQVSARDFEVGVQSQRLWDTIINCAEVDDVDVWVNGNTLYYMAPSQITRKKNYLGYGNDFIEINGSKSQQANKNVHVEVRTWNPKKRYACTTRYTYNSDGTPPTMSQSYRTVTADAIFGTNGTFNTATSYNPQTGTYSGSSTSSASSGGGFSSSVSGIPRETSGERIIIRKPNLTKDQCADLALKTLAQITRNEITVTFVVIPTPTTFANLTIESAFSLSDMPYARWNSTPTIPFFYPKRITTTFDGPSESTSAGLRMQFECYNHLPYSNEI